MSNLRDFQAKKDEIAECLIKTLDCGLKEIFGEYATSIIYDYLERNLSLKKDEIPMRIEEFRKGLRKFLSTGAYVVEKTVLKKLYSSYGLDFEEKENYDFEDYVRELKKKIKYEVRR